MRMIWLQHACGSECSNDDSVSTNEFSLLKMYSCINSVKQRIESSRGEASEQSEYVGKFEIEFEIEIEIEIEKSTYHLQRGSSRASRDTCGSRERHFDA